MKKLLDMFRTAGIVGFMLVFVSIPVNATVIQNADGFSATGAAVNFTAQLTISGDILTIGLFNMSSASTDSPDDLLSSYFFDITKNGSRPVLTYLSAAGDVYLTDRSFLDLLQAEDADLKADSPGDYTWQYKSFNAALNPFYGFGIGTVGNAQLNPNNFQGNIVGGMDYSIYAGEITTRNLHDRLLVKSEATFTFSGLTGFTEADIASSSGFGMGTVPDGILTGQTITGSFEIPEPATIALLCLGGLVLIKKR